MSEAGATLGAASIAGAIAVVGMIISKENKVSEFRQQWIDGLRSDLSTFVGTATVLHLGGLTNEKIQDLLLRLQELDCRIRLRFKRSDNDSTALIAALTGVMSNLNHAPDPANFRKNEAALKDAAQILLKNEWEVVKKGEKTYRYMLRCAFAVLLISSTAVVWWLLHYFFKSW